MLLESLNETSTEGVHILTESKNLDILVKN